MSKYSVSVADDKMVFINPKTEKAVQGDFAFVHPLENDEGLKTLQQDVKTVGKRTAAALGFILQILNSTRMDGYKGEGDINADASLGKEVKNGMREAEAAFFRPMFSNDKHGQKQYDQFIAGIRDAGIYATVKGVALKYFYFAGKLPCVYEGDNPDTGRMLSVPAMQKLLANMIDDKPKADDSIAARLGSLMHEFEENETLTENDILVIQARLGVFLQECKEALNVIAANKTQNTPLMAPSMAPVSLDDQIKVELDAIDAEAAELGIELVE